MTVQDDVAAARLAVVALEQASAAVARHYADTVDVRRLRADVDRLSADLDLLCGEAAPPEPAPRPAREVIDDTAYAHDFWMDAEDEGLGASDRRAP